MVNYNSRASSSKVVSVRQPVRKCIGECTPTILLGRLARDQIVDHIKWRANSYWPGMASKLSRVEVSR